MDVFFLNSPFVFPKWSYSTKLVFPSAWWLTNRLNINLNLKPYTASKGNWLVLPYRLNYRFPRVRNTIVRKYHCVGANKMIVRKYHSPVVGNMVRWIELLWFQIDLKRSSKLNTKKVPSYSHQSTTKVPNRQKNMT